MDPQSKTISETCLANKNDQIYFDCYGERLLCKCCRNRCGNMARCHMEVMASIPEVQISGVYSRTEQRATGLALDFGIGVNARSIGELYALTKADGVGLMRSMKLRQNR